MTTEFNQLYLSRREAAEYVRKAHGQRCTDGALATAAYEGTGPEYRLIAGRAFYLERDLDVWAASRVSAVVRRAADLRRPRQEVAA